MTTSDELTAISLVVSIAALITSTVFAGYTVFRANKTASAGVLLASQVALAGAWEQYLHCEEQREQFYFGNLLNLFEICCSLYLDKSFTGGPRKLLKSYLVSIFQGLSNDAYTLTRMTELRQDSSTFEKIKEFERVERASLSLANPLFVPKE